MSSKNKNFVNFNGDGGLALKNPTHLEWFKDAGFGMMITWGLYSLLEGSYGEHTLPDDNLPYGKSWYAEWAWKRLNIPDEEYKKLAYRFNPACFDAESWVCEAVHAGIRYLVIVSKHHDGFAMWDTKVSPFNIMQTPFGRDAMAELVEACRRHGLKYGFYYSHWQDWEAPDGAVPLWETKEPACDFERYWKRKCLPQVKELIDLFDPDLLWFDTWDDEQADITPERRDELIALVRKNSDKCLINGRIRYIDPGPHVDCLDMVDNYYPGTSPGKPWQTPATMNRSWGWHAGDLCWKSANDMLGLLANNISKGGNYLLNVGPTGEGNFPEAALERLHEMGEWLRINGEAIYAASPVSLYSETERAF